ncbi:hypothetical protein JTE90_023216 [Oedothorax gibbosus]|uniref:Uncharacterized protein n=1 Tax=Oedothorax gibbosus TaxID=931172 RepID=A0AAV6VIT0_9ARAC|nr:hypothetical protein JTE90_023216 [Oedothorax gibbosus]
MIQPEDAEQCGPHPNGMHGMPHHPESLFILLLDESHDNGQTIAKELEEKTENIEINSSAKEPIDLYHPLSKAKRKI